MGTKCKYKLQLDEADADLYDVPEEWSCSQDAHPESDYCIFHMPPSEREELGITEDDITEAFYTVLDSKGESEKQLIGAEFKNLDLSSEILTAADKHAIDLRHCVISGTLHFGESKIEHPIDIRGGTVSELKWDKADFNEYLSMDGLTVDNRFQATGVEFAADVDLRGATFAGQCILDEARFNGDTCFRDVTFENPASFAGAEFRGDANLLNDDACFNGALFKSSASFKKAEFRYADFVDCTFEEDVEFGETTFSGDAEFSDAEFCGRVDFRGTTFEGDTDVLVKDSDFSGVTFDGPVTFESATFSFVTFEGAQMNDTITFEDAIFDGDVVFTDTLFNKAAIFTEGRFYSDASFQSATFADGAQFSGAEFHGGDNNEDEDVTFADTTFTGDVSFSHARFRYVSFESSQFNDEVDFSETVFNREAVFSHATFADDVTFVEGWFKHDALFDRITFGDSVTFRGAEFEGGANVRTDDLSFEKAIFEDELDFRSVKTEFVTFAGCRFEEAAEFDETTFNEDVILTDSKFEASATFEECRFGSDANFSMTTFADEATFDGVEFHGGDNVRDDDTSFEEATFEAGVSFYRAQFTGANFQSTTFGGNAVFESTRFREVVTFESAEFEASTFTNAQFEHDADFTAVDFCGIAEFTGVAFEGGWHNTDDISFKDSTFSDEANFDSATIRDICFHDVRFDGSFSCHHAVIRRAEFDRMTIDATADISYTKFNRKASFNDVTINGHLNMNEARFESDVCFAGSILNGGGSFKGAEFTGGAHTVADADFSAANFGDTVHFEMAKFRTADFSGAIFNGSVFFENSVFSEEASFENARFKKSAEFPLTEWMGSVNFSSCRFNGTAKFNDNIFHGKTTLSDSIFNSEVTFEETIFKQQITFDDTAFGSAVSFQSVRFDDELRLYSHALEKNLLVKFNDAVISAGEIAQTKNGDVFYDCTGAEIHDIKLDNKHCIHGLFNHFRFYNTDFKGFDFTAHKKELAKENWTIHEFAASSQLLTNENSNTPAVLEETYLKAKICASNFGDRKAAAEFFIKEMVYRRHKNLDVALNPENGDSLRNRVTALGKFAGNKILHQTCGYGERLWRVVHISALVILVWGILFATVGGGTRGRSDLATDGLESGWQLFSADGITILAQNIYFSLVTFTTLGSSDLEPVGTTASFLAGLEAFIGAMLLALVVFVLGRRVAW